MLKTVHIKFVIIFFAFSTSCYTQETRKIVQSEIIAKVNTLYIFKANWDTSYIKLEKFLENDSIKMLVKDKMDIVQIDCSVGGSAERKFMEKYGELATPLSAMMISENGITSFIRLGC